MNHLPLNVRVPIEDNNVSITRLEEKCVKCGMCKDVCTNAIGVHGTYTFEQTCGEAVCINCGQCANVCPVDSITEKYEYMDVKAAIHNPEKIVIGSIYERCTELLAPAMKRVICLECLEETRKTCEIVPAMLGDSIGDYAALAVGMEE